MITIPINSNSGIRIPARTPPEKPERKRTENIERIALARIGGLRCPSELQQLRWSDVHWTENRFLVHSPKTERHEGHRERLVPLFPELRTELERHYSLDETKGNEFVIQGLQNSCWNLHPAFQAIAKRAGLGKIIRPFDNMRMSRSNEVDREFGSIDAKSEQIF